ncbi:Mlf3p Ecym_5388 [Eremothecium cymbalariae DBVPG|uniref:Uncharacterized protein n=1 Tax=Eremothecium cymbalariae (strain CBS 270.75 / DBVPG 7215 / KCTC 17166 / NRRL Y-17582) TaxID=931890 RepID=I6NDK1_ERECY|nr:hypothetical protein Ecym_5388 [Eremothecium cymbalariae DBVPG\
MEVQSICSNVSGQSGGSIGFVGDESLIFERNVEDPFVPVGADSRCCTLCSVPWSRSRSSSVVNFANCAGSQVSQVSQRHSQQQQQQQSQPCRHAMHHNLENLVAPALDASADVVADDKANLDNVEIVYSKRPSTIRLDMALGRTRTNSVTGAGSSAEGGQVQTVSGAAKPRVLRFYSYADMLSDENTHQKHQQQPQELQQRQLKQDIAQDQRPGISHSLSLTLLRHSPPNTCSSDIYRTDSCHVQQLPSFSNPFLPVSHRRDSVSSVGMVSRKRSSNPPNARFVTATTSKAAASGKFSLETSSDWSSSEEDLDQGSSRTSYGVSSLHSKGPAPVSPNSPTAIVANNGLHCKSLGSRTVPCSLKKTPSPFKATPPFQSDVGSSFVLGRRGSVQKAPSNMDDLIFNQLHSESASEMLRQKVCSTGSDASSSILPATGFTGSHQ